MKIPRAFFPIYFVLSLYTTIFTFSCDGIQQNAQPSIQIDVKLENPLQNPDFVDREYWQYFNWENWRYHSYKIFTTGEVRFDRTFSNLSHYRITGNLAYQAYSFLSFQIHYSLIGNRSMNAQQFTNLQRLELEANPIFKINKNLTFEWRNRLELTRREDTSRIQYMFRHKLTIIVPIKNQGKLTSINCSNEFFYDFNHHKIIQNRFVPLELNFQINEKKFLDVFIMLRTLFIQSVNIWYKSIVVGSEIGF